MILPVLRHAMLTLALCCAATGLWAQEATLVADTVEIRADATLVAEGNVEVFFDGTRLTASRVTYDRNGDQLTIDGPLVLSAGDDAVILADSAALDTDLTDGILESARLVLDRQLQIAASEIARAGGRFTRLSNAVASSCEVCTSGSPPLWEIRASRIVRDELERQLYFDDAQLRIVGVPVFYLPRLRLPDPSLQRATGFLVPELERRSRLGIGIRAPYFIRLGDHADLTLRPYLSADTTTLEAAYRHELRTGSLSFEGAVSRDDIRPGDTRAYLFAEGQFDLPRTFTLDFDVELVSDTAYLLDYGYSTKDRLDSALTVGRTRDDQIVQAGITSFRSLRASDLAVTDELPNELIEAELRQRLFANARWGQAWLSFGAIGLERPSNTAGVGRDVSRLSAALAWQADATLPAGLVGRAQARIDLDQYIVSEDPAFDDATRVSPAAALGLSWPLSRTDADGVNHLLEPQVQLVWAETSGEAVPNEDSTTVEFDEGNLFALSRFPGSDEVEEGLRANLGATWTRYDPAGWSLGLTVGRVLRFDTPGQFGADTGLAGSASDWLLAANYRLSDTVAVLSRALIDDNLEVNVSETRLTYRRNGATLDGSYLFRAAEPLEGRFEDIAELALDGQIPIDDNWTASADWRFEGDAGRTTQAGIGVKYENECIGVDLSVSRRFTSTTNVEPATDIALRVFLAGFGTGADGRQARRACGG
ncbi:MAG: LPS assembly protein LptD [Pseudomonadota bacterium]